MKETKNYITSDLHLFHSNIIKYAERKRYQPFDDKKAIQMSWDIVNAINEQIPDKEGVVLWNLGDLLYGKLFTDQTLAQLQSFISVLKGKHRTLNIVLGNHDKQFKKWADWNKLQPLSKDSSFTEIFLSLGFTNVYEHPIVYEDKFILSHEPVFLRKNSGFVNVHGHTHQILVDKDYFSIDLENSKMVIKAYRDSGREPPKPVKKKDWKNWIVDPNMYYNVCWDSPRNQYKVVDLDDLISKLKF